MKKFIVNSLLVVGSVAITFLAAIGADRIVGAMAEADHPEVGILFTPNSDAHYKTFEFDFVVHTNNFGFRGADITLPKRGKTRVVAIGDSFTYGWGVPIEQTWLKLVEDRMRADGHNVEVLNLGIPGAWPGRYAETAEDSVALLKPDLIVVGMLQGDDLRQCDRAMSKDPAKVAEVALVGWEAESKAKETATATATATGKDESRLVRFVKHTLFPNLTGVAAKRRGEMVAYLHEKSDRKWDFIGNTWKKQHQVFINKLSEAELARFHTLPEHLQRAFENGDLNPINLLYLVRGGGIPTGDQKGPAKLSDEFDVNSDLMQQRIRTCAENLMRIKKAAETCGAKVLVVSIPAMGYVTPTGWTELYKDTADESRKLENAESLVTTVPDEAARKACDRTGILFAEVTAAFREKAKGEKFFYDYDTHFTAAGNRLFAELITPSIENEIH